MKNIRSKLKIMIKSKNFRELADNTPPEFLSVLLLIPILIIAVIPVRQFIDDSLYPEVQKATYTLNILTVNILAAAALVIYIFIGKLKGMFSFRQTAVSIKKDPVTRFFTVFIFLMILSSAVNGFDYYTIHGSPYRYESLFTFILYFIFYFFASSRIDTARKKALVLYLNIAVSSFTALTVIIDQFIVHVPAIENEEMITAVFFNSNHYAYYLTINIITSAMLFIKGKKTGTKLLCLASFILQNIVLIINNTLGCYLACAFGLVFICILLFITEKKISRYSLLALLLFIIITLIMSIWYNTVFSSILSMFKDVKAIVQNSENAEAAGAHRWQLWTCTVKYISEKPLLGFGVEGIGERLADDARYDRPHNEFIQYAAFFGIPAALTYICGAFSVFLKGLKNKFSIDMYSLAALAAAFSYLVSSAFGNTMFYTAPYFFIMLGIGYNIKTEK